MNKFLKLALLFSSLFIIGSCGKEVTPVEEEKEEYIEVSLVPKGIDISVSPMAALATKASSSSDMYCVQVYRGEGEPPTSYATWVTNDLSSEKFKLIKGDKYCFHVMYIPNGQDILEGVGSAPFYDPANKCPGLNDGICYGTRYGNHCGIIGAAKKKGDKEGSITNGYFFNDVDRYHGVIEVEATANVTLNVNLYRQMFGLDIVAKNFTEGTIRISSVMNVFYDGSMIENNLIYLTPTSPSVSKVLEFDDMPFDWDYNTEESVKNYVGYTAFNVDYIGSDGKAMTIMTMDYDYKIKRLTKLTITLDIKEILEDIQAGLTPHVVSGESWSEVTIDY